MTHYYRLSGGGNDFLALAEPERRPDASTIAAWTARGTSAGADGLFILERLGGDRVRMSYYNADGRSAALCLNGARCAARLALEIGWATAEMTVATDAGDLRARSAGPHAIEIEIPAPAGPPTHLRIADGSVVWDGWQIDTGVPHLVVFWDRPMREAPVATAGPVLRAARETGEGGANVDFVRFVDRHQLEIRSFERGVEAETLACGTGVLAAVAVGLAHGRAELPVDALTRGGFRLGVAASTSPHDWRMTGDARLVARGELLPAAAARPEPPSW